MYQFPAEVMPLQNSSGGLNWCPSIHYRENLDFTPAGIRVAVLLSSNAIKCTEITLTKPHYADYCLSFRSEALKLNRQEQRAVHRENKRRRLFFRSLGKVRFFLGGEGWGILVFFPQKSVGPPLRFNKKNS